MFYSLKGNYNNKIKNNKKKTYIWLPISSEFSAVKLLDGSDG